jgi:hypothetical protein
VIGKSDYILVENYRLKITAIPPTPKIYLSLCISFPVLHRLTVLSRFPP